MKIIPIKSKIQTIYKTILSYCLKYRKNTESKNPKAVRTKKGRIMILSKCPMCDSKKSKFIKELEASRSWSSQGIKEIVNKILLAGDKFIPEMH